MDEIIRSSVFPAEDVFSLLPALTEQDRINLRNNFIFFEAREKKKQGCWQILYYKSRSASFVTPVAGRAYDGAEVKNGLTRLTALRKLMQLENAAQALHRKLSNTIHGSVENQNVNHISRVMAANGTEKRTRRPPAILRREGNSVYVDFSKRPAEAGGKKARPYQK